MDPTSSVDKSRREIVASDTLELIRAFKSANSPDDKIALRNAIVLKHHQLVRYLAARFSRNQHDRSDLESEGTLGLIEAVVRFDPESGAPFHAYAIYYVRSRMLASMYAARDLRVRGRAALRLSRLRRAAKDDGRCTALIPNSTLAAASGLTALGVGRLRPCLNELEPLESALREDVSSAACRSDNVDSNQTDPAIALQSSDHRTLLDRAMNTLSPRQALVIRGRFGIGETSKTSRELALQLDISRQRVDQITAAALAKLRRFGWEA